MKKKPKEGADTRTELERCAQRVVDSGKHIERGPAGDVVEVPLAAMAALIHALRKADDGPLRRAFTAMGAITAAASTMSNAVEFMDEVSEADLAALDPDTAAQIRKMFAVLRDTERRGREGLH